jgi:hypothetical protein
MCPFCVGFPGCVKSSLMNELRGGRVNPGDGKEKLLRTRRDIERGWASVSELLKLDGDVDLAGRVRQFVEEMPPAYVHREWIAADIVRRLRSSTRDRPRTL